MPLFRDPRPLRVQTTPDGQPARLYWRGRWEPVRVANTWTIEDDWHRGADAEVRRTYYRCVLTITTTICTMFRDELKGSWWMEKVLD
jgi:hypothetical protein